MGCCMSRIPDFTDAPESLADNILPETPPGESSSTLIPIKLVPQQGMNETAIAVYLPNDFDFPSYFFALVGGSFHLFKIIRTPDEELDREEVTSIISGWQTSQGHDTSSGDVIGEENHVDSYVTSKAEKKLTIKCYDDEECHVKKSYQRNEGTLVEIDSGFEMKPDQSNNCMTMSRHGQVLAYVYDKNVSDSSPGPGPGAINDNSTNPNSEEYKAMHQFMKAPVAIYLENMSMDDMHLTLAVIATAHDRLIRTAMLDVYGAPPSTP